VQIGQKTVKHTPTDKLYDAFISLLAGAHGLVEINTRLRADPALQAAFGRKACAEQSVVQETLSACTAENVTQGQHALDVIYQQHSQGFQHNYEAGFQLLDVDMSGMPCGPKAAFATKGYKAGHYHRRGRQVGRRLSTLYEEVVVDRLFAGNVQLIKALQPLVEAAETTLELDAAKRARTIIRVDAGAGTLDDINWLLARGYEVLAKEYSGQRVLRLAKTVTAWVQDPEWSERSFGWVSEPPTGYIRPGKPHCCALSPTRRHLRWTRVLICSLSAQQVLAVLGRPSSQAADPTAVLAASVTDLAINVVEASNPPSRVTSRDWASPNATRSAGIAQHMLVLLGSLAHNVVVWARRWLTSPQIQRCGILRMVRDVFPVSGLLRFDACGSVVAIVLNQEACLARSFLRPLQALLAPLHIVVSLGET
jgi:hypothetical protein